MQNMLAAQSPLSGHQLIQRRPISGRKPLQSKINNSPANTPNSTTNTKPIGILPIPDDYSSNNNNNNNNKENIPPNYSTPVNVKNESFPIESLDASLADELSAIREKLDRLRIDKDKTENMLNEKAVMLGLKLKEILHRGEVQKQLEIEVDRLYRLNEIRLACLRISPIRTLRDKEQEKKIKHDQLKANSKTQESDEHKEESPFQSPKSEPST